MPAGRLRQRALRWIGAIATLGLALACIALAPSCTLDRFGSSDQPFDAGIPGDECTSPEQCPGLFLDCRAPSCTIGNCGTYQAPQDTPCDDDGGRVCNSQGECVECTSSEHCEPTVEMCQSNLCVPASCGDQILSGDESDVDCGGSCAPCANDRVCRDGGDCVSGFCAGGICAPCGITDDCAADAWCDAGTCVPRRPGGELCTAAEQCASGFCPEDDGVCCNEECGGLCNSCIPGNTGLDFGICGAVLDQMDPDGDCPDDGAGSCRSDGSGCNGAGACRLYPSGTECVAASCTSGVRSHPDTCDGDGYCQDGGIQNCSPYQCSGPNCLTSCGSDADCLTGSYCSNPPSGTCISKGKQGDPCGAPNQCDSGFCVDGYCCENACPSSNDCMACSFSKTGYADGLCRSIPTGQNPDGECSNGACYRVSPTDGECRLSQGQSCTLATQCLTTYCVDGRCCENSCTGTCVACRGDWTVGINGECRAIPTNNDPQPECANGACYQLTATTGECRLDNGQPCTNPNQCLNATNCVDGYCCNGPCTGLCRACRADWTPAANGVCANIDSHTDPDGTGECPGTLACNGAGACELSDGNGCTLGTQCGSLNCVDGYCCNTSCTGLCRACRADWTPSANGVCDNIDAGTDPDTPEECSGSLDCNGAGACESNNGTSCTVATQCGSGNCVDGYCCDTPCGGTCVACRGDWTSGANGTCLAIPTGTDPQTPSGECTNGACYLLTATTGECRLDDGQPCTAPTQCLNNTNCVDGFCCNSDCTGLCRACRADWTPSANGVCDFIDAGTDPDTPEECGGSHNCDGNGACD